MKTLVLTMICLSISSAATAKTSPVELTRHQREMQATAAALRIQGETQSAPREAELANLRRAAIEILKREDARPSEKRISVENLDKLVNAIGHADASLYELQFEREFQGDDYQRCAHVAASQNGGFVESSEGEIVPFFSITNKKYAFLREGMLYDIDLSSFDRPTMVNISLGDMKFQKIYAGVFLEYLSDPQWVSVEERSEGSRNAIDLQLTPRSYDSPKSALAAILKDIIPNTPNQSLSLISEACGPWL